MFRTPLGRSLVRVTHAAQHRFAQPPFDVVSSHRDAVERFRFLAFLDAIRFVEDLAFDDFDFGWTRSGSFVRPVSRFHSC
jgi:hypothetical protein